jgi:hypothetical protein
MSTAHAARRGRGVSQATIELIEAARQILEEIQPATVRAVAYRLFILGLIPAMNKGSTDRVSRCLTMAREAGCIPWAHVVDETREAERIATWSDPEAIISAAVAGYRKNYWAMQPRRVEIWSEKGTVRGTLAPVLQKYGVTFRVMHGYGSATALHSIAEETAQDAKPLTALYVGDWDPSGLHMSEVDLPDRLARYGGELVITRLALDAVDVWDGTKLPFFEADTKSKDPRYRWFVANYGNKCWELDALSPVDLRTRVAGAIVGLIDIDAWDHATAIEAAEVESMQSVLSTWKSISGQARKYSPDGGAPLP